MAKSGLRWTDEQLAAHMASRGRPAPEPANPGKLPVPAQAGTPAPTGTQKLQALGRLRDGTMNKTEARFAQYLDALKHDGRVLWYRFEGIKLKLAEKTHLTVDFAVLEHDGMLKMYDVKGARAIVADDAKAKTKVAADMYPFAFFLVYPRKDKDGGGWDIERV